MQCQKCDSPTKVVDSRESAGRIRRRRECLACSHRFSTYEQAYDSLSPYLSNFDFVELEQAVSLILQTSNELQQKVIKRQVRSPIARLSQLIEHAQLILTEDPPKTTLPEEINTAA